MKKKTYIIPEMKDLSMETLEMIAFSGNSNTDVHASGEGDDSDDPNRSRFSHWEDVDEDDEF